MANTIKRHFYLDKDYKIDYETKTVQLLPAFFEKLRDKKLWGRFGFKKVGGSSIGNVLSVNPWVTSFGAWAAVVWLSVPVLDRKYVDAGIAIEPKVISLIEKVSGKKVQTFDAKTYNYDFFAGKDDVLGGLPDGYIKETDTILEIKTSGKKNLEKWNTYGIPVAYQKQAQLYAYLMGAKTYSIVGTFLEEEDYLDPSTYKIENRKTKNWTYKVNMLQAEDDIKKVKTWYSKYTSQPNSPQFNPTKDAELLEWLNVRNDEEQLALLGKWEEMGKYVR